MYCKIAKQPLLELLPSVV